MLFPVDGWLYSGAIMVYNEHQPPGPGGMINFIVMFVYMVVMVALLTPQAKRKHRPSQFLMAGMALFILWVLSIALLGEIAGSWNAFSLVPFGIDFWAAAVYITINRYDSFPSYEKRYRVLFENAPIGIIIADNEGTIREASPRVSEHLAIPLNRLIGRSLYANLEPQERARRLHHYRSHFDQREPLRHFEFSFRNEDGRDVVLSISSAYIEMEGNAYQLLIAEDVSESVRREKEIHRLAFYDQLTGLPNRAAFNLAFEAWRTTKPTFALMVLDLNGFKHINDEYGHLTGDEALKHFAERMQASISPDDFAARLSGDEFVLMLADAKDIEPVIHSIRAALSEPLEASIGSRLTLSTSIGVGRFPADGNRLDELFKAADDRMYADKRSGKISW